MDGGAYQQNNNPFSLFPSRRKRNYRGGGGFGVLPLPPLPPAQPQGLFGAGVPGGFGGMQPAANNLADVGGYSSGSDYGDAANAQERESQPFSLSEEE